MIVFAEIGAWQFFKVFLSTLPEITAWVAVLAGIGLMLGTGILMLSLRWMLPWSRLYSLRKGRHGWFWFCVQWGWVFLWGLTLPALGLTIGALTGTAFGARTLVLRENVGQVVGERVLAPVCVQVAHQVQHQYPKWGDVAESELELDHLKEILESLSPQLLEAALKNVRMLDDKDLRVGAMELAGRRFARKAIYGAADTYFAKKKAFVAHIIQNFEERSQQKVCLKDVVTCASHLYFTPAFASWTFWWILSHAGALIPVMLACWLIPSVCFGLLWWWLCRRASLRERALSTSTVEQ